MRTKVSRNQLIRRLVNLPTCLVGLEAGAGSHHIAHQIQLLGHDVRLIPAQYVKPFLNETATFCSPTRVILKRFAFRGAEAVQRPALTLLRSRRPSKAICCRCIACARALCGQALVAHGDGTPRALGERPGHCAGAGSAQRPAHFPVATGVPFRRQNDASTRGVLLIPSASPSAMPPTSGAPAVPMTPRPPTHLDERREFREAKDPHFVCPPYH
jgi:hypothetical protein